MNIILIHYAAPPIVGGVESVMAQHARLLAQDGHRVCIIAGRGSQTDERVEFTPVPEVDSRNPEVLELKKALDTGQVPTGFQPMVERIISQLRPHLEPADRVIAHNVCSLNKNLALTAALHALSEQAATGKYVLWHHDLAWTTPRYRNELYDGYPWDLLRTDWPWVQQVVVSETRRTELAALLNVQRDRIHVVPNGVDVGHFLKLEDETESLRQRFRLDDAAPLVLLPVRITPRKNIELALRVLASIRFTLGEAKLLVTGPLGPHNPANENYFVQLMSLRAELQLEHAAIFLAEAVEHSISDSVIADLYRMADLLFLPSREEGFGIPILEAGLAGIPVFCSDIEVLRELGGSQVEYFSPDADPQSLAAQIAARLASSQTYAMRKRTLESYSWEQIYRDKIVPLLMKG